MSVSNLCEQFGISEGVYAVYVGDDMIWINVILHAFYATCTCSICLFSFFQFACEYCKMMQPVCMFRGWWCCYDVDANQMKFAFPFRILFYF